MEGVERHGINREWMVGVRNHDIMAVVPGVT
jgi:hypothetical protein